MRHRQIVLLPLLMALATSAIADDVIDLSLDDLVNTKITTASKFSQPIAESPSSATVILGEEIRGHGWTNLGEILSSVPGFEISTATDYRYLGVRGFSQPGDYNSRILLLIDGIASNDGVYDQAMIGPEFPLDIELIERIEVVPGSALYGGNAYVAVVNVFTRQSGSIGRSVTLGAGSGGLVRGQASTGGVDETGRHWLVSVSSERTPGVNRYFPQWQGIDSSDGWARGQDGERVRRLFLRYGGEEWSLHLLHGWRQKDAAGGMFGTDFSVPAPNTDATSQIGLHFRHPLNAAWALQGQAYAGKYDWEGRYRYSGVWESDATHSGWLGAGVQLTGRPWENQTWVVGASIRDDFKRDQENAGGLAKGKRRTLSFFAQDEVRLNNVLTLNLGGRFDRDTLNISQSSPRAALLVNLPESMVLKFMTSRAFRPPNAYESDYSYPVTQLPGGNLRPERVRASEVALEQVIGGSGRWTASVYHNQFRDLLGILTDYSTGIQQIRNVGDARTTGLELGARYRFNRGVDLRGSLAAQNSEDATGAPLANSPRRLAKLLALLPLGGQELGWETYYTGPRQDVFGDRVGGQTVSHATLSAHLSRDLRWQLRVRNVFDRRLAVVVGGEYSLGMAGNVPTIADYGRQFRLSLTADF